MSRFLMLLIAFTYLKSHVNASLFEVTYIDTFQRNPQVDFFCSQAKEAVVPFNFRQRTPVDLISQTVISISKLNHRETDDWSVIAMHAIHKIDNTFDKILTTTGKACVFPFEYRDKTTYVLERKFTCQSGGMGGGGSSGCWCSTASQLGQNNWGYCPCAAPLPGIPLYTKVVGGVGMEPCHFPFLFMGIEHHTCITSPLYQVHNCWCGIQYNVDGSQLKAKQTRSSSNLPPNTRICPCGKTTLEGRWSEWSSWSDCECGELTLRERECKAKHANAPSGTYKCRNQGVEIGICGCKSKRIANLTGRTGLIDNTHLGQKHKKTTKFRILDIEPSDAGAYKCNELYILGVQNRSNALQTQRETLLYILNVVNPADLFLIFTETADVQIPYEEGVHDGNEIVWRWSKWQDCDRCGILIGEQRKYGFCYTIHPPKSTHMLPCRSVELPEDKRQRLAMYKDIVAVKNCQSRCVVDDNDYTFVEAVPGEMPSMPPPVVREIIKKYNGDKLVLDCIGGNLFKPVNWQYDGLDGTIEILLRRKVKEGKFPLFASLIDTNDTLHLNEVKMESEGYFSCFVNRTLMVSYRLIVEKKVFWVLEAIVDKLIYFALGVVVIIFVLTLWATFSKRKKSPGI